MLRITQKAVDGKYPSNNLEHYYTHAKPTLQHLLPHSCTQVLRITQKAVDGKYPSEDLEHVLSKNRFWLFLKDNVHASLHEGYVEVANVVVSVHFYFLCHLFLLFLKDNVHASLHEGYVEVANVVVSVHFYFLCDLAGCS